MEKYCKILNYEEEYIISTFGNVKRIKTGKILTPLLGTCGYLYVSLCKKGFVKRIGIHRLVGKAFIPNPKNKGDINHKDGNKHNNNVKNLEWMTRSENCKHAYLNGLTPPPPSWAGKYGYDHNRSIEIHQYNRETGGFIQSFGSISECSRETGISISGIHYALHNSQNKRKRKNKYFYSIEKNNNYGTIK